MVQDGGMLPLVTHYQCKKTQHPRRARVKT